MPIIFEELERLLLSWKKETNFSRNRNSVADFIFDSIEDKRDKLYKKKFLTLVQAISVKDIQIAEILDTSNTYGKLKLKTIVTVKKRSNI